MKIDKAGETQYTRSLWKSRCCLLWLILILFSPREATWPPPSTSFRINLVKRPPAAIACFSIWNNDKKTSKPSVSTVHLTSFLGTRRGWEEHSTICLNVRRIISKSTAMVHSATQESWSLSRVTSWLTIPQGGQSDDCDRSFAQLKDTISPVFPSDRWQLLLRYGLTT